MNLRRLLFALVLAAWVWVCTPCLAQTAADPNEGLRLGRDPATGLYQFSWWGRAGRTYFLQQSSDLLTWTFVPIIEPGADGPLRWGFTSNAGGPFFLRLQTSDLPASDPFAADFNHDGLTNWQNLTQGSDPLAAAVFDGNGLPLNWAAFYHLAPGTDADALAPRGDGLTYRQAFQQGLNPNDAFDGQRPGLAVVGGDRQAGLPSSTLARALVVQVSDHQGRAVQNIPVTFTTDAGGLRLTANGAPIGAAATVRTGPSGQASIYLTLPAAAPLVCHLTASATSGTLATQVSALAACVDPNGGGSGGNDDPDLDGNGLSDGWEVKHFGANGNDPDSDADQDGLTTFLEQQRGANPMVADTDQDGKLDGQDAVPYEPLLRQAPAAETKYAVIDLGPGQPKQINDAGQVLYDRYDAEWGNLSHLWQKGESINLGFYAHAMNNTGVVVGEVRAGHPGGPASQEWRDGENDYPWYCYPVKWADGQMQDLTEHFLEVYSRYPQGFFMHEGADDVLSTGEIWGYAKFERILLAASSLMRATVKVPAGAPAGRSAAIEEFHQWARDIRLTDPLKHGVANPGVHQERVGAISCRHDLRSFYHTRYVYAEPWNPGYPPGAYASSWIDLCGAPLCVDPAPANDDPPYALRFLAEEPGMADTWDVPVVLIRRIADPAPMTPALAALRDGQWRRATLKDAGKPISGSYPAALNRRGEILLNGASATGSNVTYHASIWHNGHVDKLDDLIGNPPDWHITQGADLNGAGAIAAVGYRTSSPPGTSVTSAHALLLLPADLMVDSNRDEVVKFAGTFNDLSTQGKPQDATSETKPFRFWLNDDSDQGDEDHPGSSTKDFNDSSINSRRDLEDFTRLDIYLGGLHEAVTQGTIKIGLKWKNTGGTSPSVKVWRNRSPHGDIEYLTDDTVAQQHLALTQPGHVQGTSDYIIPTQFWVDSGFSASQPNGYLLFEGVTEGKGQLVMTIHKADGTEIGEGPGVWLHLLNVKKMYQRGKGTPVDGIPAPYETYFNQPNLTPTGYIDDPNGNDFVQPADEADSLVVFVHGIHAPFMNANDSYTSNIITAETVFKRLWHQGFKGRFAFYKWPALNPAGFGSTGFEFNYSEFRAWKYGRGLAQFVNSINKSSKNLFAHSQGNIVCGAALRDFGLSVNNYVLTQAAVPAGSYDVRGGQNDPNSINGYERFWSAEANDPTPDQANDLGYRGYLSTLRVLGNVTNFHNLIDFALVTGRSLGFIETNWEENQEEHKPDGSFSNSNYYDYDPAMALGQRCQLVDAFFVGRKVLDRHESMALVARPRSKAAGALTNVRGSVTREVDLSQMESGAGEEVFTRSSDDHSAQVARRIQEVWTYFTRVGQELQVIPTPE